MLTNEFIDDQAKTPAERTSTKLILRYSAPPLTAETNMANQPGGQRRFEQHWILAVFVRRAPRRRTGAPPATRPTSAALEQILQVAALLYQ